MGFEPEAHRRREVRSKDTIRTKDPHFPGAGLMDYPSLLFLRYKGNLRVRYGIAYAGDSGPRWKACLLN
jgi:hypothetical protein